MERGFLLDVVVREDPTVLELLARKDEPLLVWGGPPLVLDLGLDALDAVRWLDLERDGLAGKGLHKDLSRFPIHCQRRARVLACTVIASRFLPYLPIRTRVFDDC